MYHADELLDTGTDYGIREPIRKYGNGLKCVIREWITEYGKQ